MGGRPSGQKGRRYHVGGGCRDRRAVCHPALHRSAHGAGGRPEPSGAAGPLGQGGAGGGAQGRHLPDLHGRHLPDEGDPPGIRVPRGRAQDHCLLRGRRPPHGGECPQIYPLPPPVRHQLFDSGGHRQRVPVQRAALVQHQPAGGVQAAAPAAGHGHQLRAAQVVRPVGQHCHPHHPAARHLGAASDRV